MHARLRGFGPRVVSFSGAPKSPAKRSRCSSFGPFLPAYSPVRARSSSTMWTVAREEQMAAKHSGKQIEQIKRARSKKVGRYVVRSSGSGMIAGKSVG